MRTALLALIALVSVGTVGSALAQESLLPLPLEKTSVAAALEKSKREHRVLVVVREWKRPPQGRRPWWCDDCVRAWIGWHGVLVQTQPGDAEGKIYYRNIPRDESNKFWGIDVFVDGRQIKLLDCSLKKAPTSTPLCRLDPCDPEAANGPDDLGTGGPCVSPTATSMLGSLQLILDASIERNALWGQLHNLDCPEPLRPGRYYWYAKELDGIPRTVDASTPDAGDRYVDVAARIAAADAALFSGDTGGALALLTWAWERGGDVDPAFALARVGVILPRMAALKAKDPRVADRVKKVANAEWPLYPWFDDDEEASYFALLRQCDQGADAMTRLGADTVDPDEETRGGLVGGRIGKLKALVISAALDRPLPPGEWQQLVQAARVPLPKTADQVPRERWQRGSVELLTIAAVRPYSLLLASADASDRARAAQIATDVLKTSESAPPAIRAKVLRALVFAAVSVGKAGETERAWLGDAEKLDSAAKGGAIGRADPLSRMILPASK